MKPTSEIRRENLLALVEEAGSQVAIAARLGKDKNQVYQWLLEPGSSGSRNIGPRSARSLEDAFGKPHGWLDHEHAQEKIVAAPPPSQPERLDPDMVAETIRALRLYYRRRGKEYDPERQPADFVWAYGLRLSLGDEPSTAELIDFGAKLAERLAKKAEAARGNQREGGEQAVGGD